MTFPLNLFSILFISLFHLAYSDIESFTLLRSSNLVDTCMLYNSGQFIEAYENGTCYIFNSNYHLQSGHNCCNDSTISIASMGSNDCWIVGCASYVQMFCGNESNATSLNLNSFSPNASSIEYIPVWPFLDIHIKPQTVITCDVSSYTFSCNNFTRDLSEITVKWIGEAQQSTKVLTFQGYSKLFIYNENSEPKILQLSEEVEAVAQNGYQTLFWTNTGLYHYRRNEDSSTITQQTKRMNFSASTKFSLACIDETKYYLDENRSLIQFDNSTSTSLLDNYYLKLKQYRWGFFLFNETTLSVYTKKTKTEDFGKNPTPISQNWNIENEYQDWSFSSSTNSVNQTNSGENSSGSGNFSTNPTSPTNQTNSANQTNHTNQTESFNITNQSSANNLTNQTQNIKNFTNFINPPSPENTTAISNSTNQTMENNTANFTNSTTENQTNLNTTNQTNQTNQSNQTHQNNKTNQNSQTNTTNTTNVTNITNESNNPTKTYLCYEGCQLCFFNQTCLQCESGYGFNKQKICEIEITFALATSLASFPYSAVALKMVFLQFMEEFWFYEFHDHEYSPKVKVVLQTLGNMNRKRFIPIFVKEIVGEEIYNNYQRNKHHWGFSNRTLQTDEKYLKIEKEPINFTVTASKMYIWSYLLSIFYFLINAILGWLFSSNELMSKIFIRSKIPSTLFIIFIEGNVQFISFSFFRQVRNPGSQVFLDKVNLIVTVLFMFVAFIYTICSFVIYSNCLKKKHFRVLFPVRMKNKALNMLLVMFMGPGRNLLLGFFQSLYEDFVLQMVLLIGLNIVTLLVLSLLKYTKVAKYFIIFKTAFVLLSLLFVISGLFSHMNFIFQCQTYEVVQLICLCAISSICIMDFFLGFTNFFLLAIDYFQKKKSKTESEDTSKEEIKKQVTIKKPPTQPKIKQSKSIVVENI